MSDSNLEVVLTEYVGKGNKPEAKHFLVQDAKDRNVELKDGEVRLETLYLSVDPYMRGRMNPDKSYAPPFTVGNPLNGSGCGRVTESKNGDYQVGDLLTSQKSLTWPWRQYVIFNAEEVTQYTKINDVPEDLVPHTIGQLGMPGLTAYFGLLDRGQPKESETLVVSGGAGACGSVAGQIGKLKGLRVIGIAGSDDKVDWMVKELGFDAGINYTGKSAEQISDELKQLAPNGVDIYYDNVGGDISVAVLRQLNQNARVPICGQISQYDKAQPDSLPDDVEALLKERNVSRGWFMVFSYKTQFETGWKELFEWVTSGKIKVQQTVYEKIEEMPNAFLALFSGKNLGKLVVKIK